MAKSRTPPHVDERDTDQYPVAPNTWQKSKWVGWLTTTEYNVMDFTIRFGWTDIFRFQGKGKSEDSCRSLHSRMVHCGLLKGPKDNYSITDKGMELFRKTDQYILDMDLED